MKNTSRERHWNSHFPTSIVRLENTSFRLQDHVYETSWLSDRVSNIGEWSEKTSLSVKEEWARESTLWENGKKSINN